MFGCMRLVGGYGGLAGGEERPGDEYLVSKAKVIGQPAGASLHGKVVNENLRANLRAFREVYVYYCNSSCGACVW